MLSRMLRAATRETYALSFLTQLYSGSGLTTYTFSSVSLGETAKTREIFVLVRGVSSNTRTVSSASVGGVTATIGTNQVALGTGRYAVIFARVPNGQTGNISVTFSGSMTGCHIAAYRVASRPKIGNNQTDFASNSTGGATSLSTSALTTSADGFSLMTFNRVTSGGVETTTSNNYTQDAVDESVTNLAVFAFSYSRIGTTASTPTQTFSWTGSQAAALAGWSFN